MNFSTSSQPAAEDSHGHAQPPPKALMDASDEADAPDEGPSQVDVVQVPQVRPSSGDSIDFSSE